MIGGPHAVLGLDEAQACCQRLAAQGAIGPAHEDVVEPAVGLVRAQRVVIVARVGVAGRAVAGGGEAVGEVDAAAEAKAA